MRHLFIINPAAGNRESTVRLERMISELEIDCETAYTEEAGDAERLARQAAQTGEPVRIYACGGDGTLNEVVNGAAGYENAAVTCVPKGTGNDFLKIFGPDYRRLFYDLPALAQGPQTPFDLMECNGKLGLDVVCAGLDARVAADVHRYKRWAGRMAYIFSLLVNVLFKGIARPLTVELCGERWSGEAAVLCVCNGRHYGGGFMPVPEAMPDDGILDVLLIPKVGLLTLARLVGKYARGRYRDYPELIRAFHGTEVSWSSPREGVAVVDGEVLRDTAFTVRLSEKKLNFFYPAGASYAPPPGTKVSTRSSQM